MIEEQYANDTYLDEKQIDDYYTDEDYFYLDEEYYDMDWDHSERDFYNWSY